LQVAVARLLGFRWPEQANDGLESVVAEDGIVCIPAVRGDPPAAARVSEMLARGYGQRWKAGTLEQLLAGVGFSGQSLEDWLRDGFFEQHCALFHQRPFVWHVWDGRGRDGFGALVNYHKLDHKLLERLTYTYLGDWIKWQRDGVAKEEAGADARLAM